MDLLGTTGLVEGTGIDISYNDGAGTITISATGGATSGVLLLENGEDASDVPGGTAVGTLIFEKG
jgi:hypothetical protein